MGTRSPFPFRVASAALFALGLALLSGCGAASSTLKGSDALAHSRADAKMAAEAPMAPPVDADVPAERGPKPNTEAYDRIVENPFLTAGQNPLSTFSIDVDTASYSNVRRFLLDEHRLPPPDAVRLEELINYFPYAYMPPKDAAPFAAHAEVAGCPWNAEHRLVRIGIKGREVTRDSRPPCNLVFLVDISGSMNQPRKLPLVQRGLSLLVNELTEKDRVALVVYAAGTGVVLPSTPATDRGAILGALERLQAGGSTNAGAGIQLAYDEATRHFLKGGVNRVILCTDGDFNVGITSQGDLTRLIEDKAKSGVFLTVLGFGMGNYKDAMLVQLADKGNGNYAYIDTLSEARKVLVEQASGTLVTIAKDVKIQVEFNPARVSAYRLIGYEKRLLRAEDFNDDRKDAGEIGAGHTVTALCEVVPFGKTINVPNVDPLKYQQPTKPSAEAKGPDLLTLKLRYKAPDGDQSKLLEFPVVDGGAAIDRASAEFRFAAAVAQFGLLLRQSAYQGEASYAKVRDLATPALGADPHGYRREFLTLVGAAEGLAKK